MTSKVKLLLKELDLPTELYARKSYEIVSSGSRIKFPFYFSRDEFSEFERKIKGHYEKVSRDAGIIEIRTWPKKFFRHTKIFVTSDGSISANSRLGESEMFHFDFITYALLEEKLVDHWMKKDGLSEKDAHERFNRACSYFVKSSFFGLWWARNRDPYYHP